MRLLQSAKLGGGSTLERTKIKLSELQNETETSGTIVFLKGSVRVHRKFSCDLKINNSHGKFWWEKL